MTLSPGLDILSAGSGHDEIKFDGKDAIAVEKARRIITDMLRRGYALFIETEKGLVRVESFNPERMTYIIGTEALYSGDPEPLVNETLVAPATDEHPAIVKEGKKLRGRPRKTEVPVGSVRSTAIPRTAGG